MPLIYLFQIIILLYMRQFFIVKPGVEESEPIVDVILTRQRGWGEIWHDVDLYLALFNHETSPHTHRLLVAIVIEYGPSHAAHKIVLACILYKLCFFLHFHIFLN